MSNRTRRESAAAVVLACAAALLPLTMAIAPARGDSGNAASGSAAQGGSVALGNVVVGNATTAGLSYVALGDSYSAGYGLQPLTELPVPGCAQSAQDYPHQVAATLELDLTDVTCSGAMTANITTTAQSTGNGTAPPQDSALSDTTRIVTLTIGGDDLGFPQIAVYCAAFSANGPLLTHPLQRGCTSHYTAPGPDNLQTKLDGSVLSGVTAALTAIHTKAPHAKVFVLGYPALAPDAANTPADGCFRSLLGTDGYPFTNADVPFLFQTGQTLDDEIRSAASAAGDTFVPTLQASLPHTPCAASAQPPGTPWINGLSVASLTPPSLQPGSLHPDEAGVAYVSTQLSAAIKAAFPPPPTKTPSPRPHAEPAPVTGSSHSPVGVIVVVAAIVVIAAIVVAYLLIRRRRRRESQVNPRDEQ